MSHVWPELLEEVPISYLSPIAATCAIIFSAGVLTADDFVETLSATWDGQRSAIATARFRARTFRSGTVRPLSHAEVDSLLKSVDLAERPDDLRTVVAAIWKQKNVEPWTTVDVTTDGTRLRQRLARSPAGKDDYVAGGGITVSAASPQSSHRQIEILAVGRVIN